MSEDSASRQADRVFLRFSLGAAIAVLVSGAALSFFLPLAYVAEIGGLTLILLGAKAEVIRRRRKGLISSHRMRPMIIVLDVLWSALALWVTSLFFPRVL